MSQEKLESECLQAFRLGSKQDAERLLSLIVKPADFRTIEDCACAVNLFVHGWKITIASESSLVHLAAVHGWLDIVIDLILKYKCDANCENSDKRTPLYSASATGQLEVVRPGSHYVSTRKNR